MATIKEVAKIAKVSTATVSRVLNGNYPVSNEAYTSVMNAVKETGYKGNAIAKSLKMNRTFMIGLVVPDISNLYFMEIAKGIEEIISPFGYTLTICSTDNDPEKEVKVLDSLNNKRVDAVVLASCHQDSQVIQSYLNQGMKVFLVDSKFDSVNTNYVGEDNYNNSKTLIEYCISMGHRDIAIIVGLKTMGTTLERVRGYEKALKEHGIDLCKSYYLSGSYQSDLAYKQVYDLLKSDIQNPTAIYATNNKMAEGALLAIKEMGLKVPEDISLISYGNISLYKLIEPQLTVIEQNPKSIGIKTGDLLKKLLVDKKEVNESHTELLTLKHGTSVKQIKE